MAFRLLILLCCLLTQSAVAKVSISTSIKPLQLIAQAVAGETADVTVLANASQSAHQFSLRPTDRINLERADLVLWIGPEFERQLAEFMSRYEARKPIIASANISGVSRLTLQGNVLDPHLWLGITNAESIAQSLGTELVRLSPEDAAAIDANLRDFRRQLQQLREQIHRDFTAVKMQNPIPTFVVYHNALQYFEADIGIEHALALVHDPDREPSIREMLDTRNALSEINPRCLFMEPDANQAIVNSLFQDRPVTRVILDLLGYSSQTNYVDLISGISRAMSTCLSGNM